MSDHTTSTALPLLAQEIPLPLGVFADSLDLEAGVRAALGDSLLWTGSPGGGKGIFVFVSTPLGAYSVLHFEEPVAGRDDPRERLVQLASSFAVGVADPLTGPEDDLVTLVEALADGHDTTDPVCPRSAHLALAMLTRPDTGTPEVTDPRVQACVALRNPGLPRYLRRVVVRMNRYGLEDQLEPDAMHAVRTAMDRMYPTDVDAGMDMAGTDLAASLLAVPRSDWDDEAARLVTAWAGNL